ncbi:MAG: hypothetical protein NTX45_19895 [Proteobacteria bacterium]|nr:hypothetical protein [Pseudomonadota bacterium]
MIDLTQVPDADLVREIYRRIKGESDWNTPQASTQTRLTAFLIPIDYVV